MAEEYTWIFVNGRPHPLACPFLSGIFDTSFPANAKWVFHNVNGKIITGYTPPDTPDSSYPDSDSLPKWSWRNGEIGDSVHPHNGYMLDVPRTPTPTGAFRNAENLSKVNIPSSVLYISPEAFRFTALTKVRINPDCEYSETSFPEGCKITFYGEPDVDDYVQLCDKNGKALLTKNGARILVKRGENMEDDAVRINYEAEEIQELLDFVKEQKESSEI